MKNLDPLTHSKVLLVASNGGHLKQALRWSELLNVDSQSELITFHAGQVSGANSISRIHTINYIAPRNLLRVLLSVPKIFRIIGCGKFDYVFSTGSGIAISAVIASKLRKVPFVYVESISRVNGPSLTGRVLSMLPKIQLFSQHNYLLTKWKFLDKNVFQGFKISKRKSLSKSENVKVLVSLGSIQPYTFQRAINHILELLPPKCEVIWQLGSSFDGNEDLPGSCFRMIQQSTFAQHLRDADIVFCHAGIGLIYDALEADIIPVVFQRQRKFNEHVDDHQMQISDHLGAVGLVVDGFKYSHWEEIEFAIRSSGNQ